MCPVIGAYSDAAAAACDRRLATRMKKCATLGLAQQAASESGSRNWASSRLSRGAEAHDCRGGHVDALHQDEIDKFPKKLTKRTSGFKRFLSKDQKISKLARFSDEKGTVRYLVCREAHWGIGIVKQPHSK